LFFDHIFNRTIRGWAYDSRHPERPPVLRIQINGLEAGFTLADRPRPDLAAAGITNFPRGFEWYVPPFFGEIRSVRVLLAEGDVELPLSGECTLGDPSNRLLTIPWKRGLHYRFPSFFILGAAKCGTTSLHGYLGQHPQICVSLPKEPFFFEAEWEHGADFYFHRYFSHWAGEMIVGEARHRNLYLPYVPQRIFEYNPEARLIVCLRNPVDRAVSHWWHWFSRGEEVLSFHDSICQDWRRIQAGVCYNTPENRKIYAEALRADGKGFLRTYLDSGYYEEQILRYLSLFPKQRLKVILFEDLVADPHRVIAETCQFLGADPEFATKIDYTPLNGSSPGMLRAADNNTLTWLMEHYRPHNERLSQLIDRPLQWDRVPT
jgi:Sulfotransferase domain